MPLKNYDNIIGNIYGGLQLISVKEDTEKGKRRKCEVVCLTCDKSKTLKLHKVIEGNYKSCGCKKNERSKNIKINYDSLIGEVIYDYFILSHNKESRKLSTKCIFCKNIKCIDRYKLSRGLSGKCECLLNHNMSKSKIYNRWKSMKSRCNNPNHSHYNHYGARGVKVCDRWATSFENFYKDMGEPPTEKHQIDRIDNDGNYEPNNCRWVTPTQNINNQREKQHNKTGYQNVCFKRGRYESSFEFNKVYYHVGTFDTPKEAYEECIIKKEQIKTKNNKDIV
ncbi:MAG: hypothetical protein ACTHY0_07965 [Mammaliicoccus vitulinus]